MKNNTARILIADDNFEDVLLAQKEIIKFVEPCKFGIAGNIKMMQQMVQSFRPDIIIYGYSVAQRNDSAILEIIKKNNAEVPIIIFTPVENEEEALLSLTKGVYDYVLKDRPKRLGITVKNALTEILYKNELSYTKKDIDEYEKYIEKYRRWEMNIPGMVYQFILHQDHSYSFIYVSSASRTMFGMEPEKIVSDMKYLNDLMHPDDLEITQAAIIQSATTLKTFKQEVRFILNEETKWYRFIAKPELQANGDVIWDGFMIDNTENKHLEEELNEERIQINSLINALKNGRNFDETGASLSLKDTPGDKHGYNSAFIADAFFDQNQFKILMDNLPDSIYFKDLESRYIRVNKHFVMKVGEFSEIQVLGKTDSNFLDTRHADEARRDELKIIKTGKPIINKIEKELWPSGLVTWVSTTKMALRDSSGKIIGTFGISRDISKSKHMEETLAQERNLLREIIDAIPERIYVRDSHGNFMLNNITDLNYLGVKDQKETIGRNDFEFLPHKIAAPALNEDKNVIQSLKSILNKEEKFESAAGTKKWYSTTKVALVDIHGKITGMVGISHDITKRKEIESALIASEDQLNNALKIASLAYWEMDIINYMFTFNDQFYALLRTTAEQEGGYEMISETYAARFIPADDRAIISLEIKKAVETDDPEYSNQIEHKIRYADGNTGYFLTRFYIIKNNYGRTISSYGTTQDITDRKRAEEALRDSEYFLRKSQSIARIGSYNLDLKNMVWEGSETINEIFGIDDSLEKNIDSWFKLIHPDERDGMFEYFQNHVIKSSSRFEKEYRIIRLNDNKERWVLSLGDVEFDGDGKPAKLIGTTQDVTERVLREKEKYALENQLKQQNTELEKSLQNLKQMQRTLVQSEKMASIGQLTAGIAHEINNPLAFVSSNINRLKEYFEDTVTLLNKWAELGVTLKNKSQFEKIINSIEEFSEEIDFNFIQVDFGSMMESITEGTNRIKKIVEGLRGFAHRSNSSFSKTSINQAIDDTLTIVWNELKYKATISKHYGDIPLVKCNIGEIKQVLVNLLVNAGHSINENGIITINTGIEEEFVIIKIEDTGCGITEENLKRIFDPFFTTKAVGKGTGLGLWVSSAIIEKHGGTLTVESEVGKGSIFTVKLPLEKHNDKIFEKSNK